MDVPPADGTSHETEWGVAGRSFIWFLQSSFLSFVAFLALGMGAAGWVVAMCSSFFAVFLLFRHVDALIDEKAAERPR